MGLVSPTSAGKIKETQLRIHRFTRLLEDCGNNDGEQD